jgi:hypothetical protein
MEVLWLAILLYSVGLGLVLYFRPKLMFMPNGTWKEFGYQRDARHTMFPFWLFAITWAFVSYAVAAATSAMIGPSDVGMAATTASWMASNAMSYEDDTDITDLPEDEEGDGFVMERASEMPAPRPRGRPRKTPYPAAPLQSQARQGYYVLDPNTRDEGLHRYIYYGPERPAI